MRNVNSRHQPLLLAKGKLIKISKRINSEYFYGANFPDIFESAICFLNKP